MKQSKYSKRRPANGMGYRVDPKKKKHTSQNTVQWVQDSAINEGGSLSHPTKLLTPTYLNEYELVVFIDDIRSVSQVHLPKHKQLLCFTGFTELYRWIENMVLSPEWVPLENAFFSFDHYLDEVDRGRWNGTHCLEAAYEYSEKIAKRVDIQGHSSDHVKNEDKLNFWYPER